MIGADNLNQIDKWERWDEVVSMAKIIAVGRPGYDMKKEYPFDTDIYPVGISTISSTEVKNRIQNGQSLMGFVPLEVGEYILLHRLYL